MSEMGVRPRYHYTVKQQGEDKMEKEEAEVTLFKDWRMEMVSRMIPLGLGMLIFWKVSNSLTIDTHP